MHEYYTPKTLKIQAVLYIFTIFVNYADFYVNIVMLTAAIISLSEFTILYYLSRCSAYEVACTLNVVFASIPSYLSVRVNSVYLQCFFCTT